MENRPPKFSLPAEFPGAIWYGTEEIEAVTRVLKNQSPFRYYGPNCQFEAKKLEEEFACFIASKPNSPWPERSQFNAIAVNSGTGALEIALDALGVGCGDEVIVQGFMWVATISAIIRNRAIPVLVDSDETLNMDPEDIRNRITERTKVIIPIPMLGGSAKIGRIMEIVREINTDRQNVGLPSIRVLEDCAQALGGYAKGIPGSLHPLGADEIHRLGTFGDISIFSFQINKDITAGEGGIIVTQDKELARRAEALHNVGYARSSKNACNWYGDDPLGWGQGRRMTELQAAIVRVQLEKIDAILTQMRESNARIEDFIKSLGIKTRPHVDPTNPGDTGYYNIFYFSSEGLSEAEKIAKGRRIAAALAEYNLHPWFMHDFEIHVYYNLIPLVQKIPMNNGCPWECPKNEFHKLYQYSRGVLPHLDEYLITSIGINIPSKLTREQEDQIIAVLGYVYENFIKA